MRLGYGVQLQQLRGTLQPDLKYTRRASTSTNEMQASTHILGYTTERQHLFDRNQTCLRQIWVSRMCYRLDCEVYYFCSVGCTWTQHLGTSETAQHFEQDGKSFLTHRMLCKCWLQACLFSHCLTCLFGANVAWQHCQLFSLTTKLLRRLIIKFNQGYVLHWNASDIEMINKAYSNQRVEPELIMLL